MNGLSTLLPFLIMQVATSAPTTTFPARIDAAAGAGPTVQGGASRGASTAFAIGLDWYYRRPIVEDAAPFGLQAYLQRLDAISLGLQAGGFGAKRDVEEDHSRTFGARLGWLGHWRRYLFAGEAAYEHIDEQQRFTATGGEASRRAHVVRPSLSLGIRDQAFELRATYLWPLAVEGEAFSVPTWRAFALSGRLVLEHAQSLSLGLYTLPNNGAGASATYEYFHGRRVSLWLRARYDSGQFYPPIQCDDTTRYEGAAGLRHWLSGRFEWRFWISALALRAVCTRADVQDVDPAYGKGDALVQVLANVGIVARVARRPVAIPPAPSPVAPPPDQPRIIEIR